MICLSLVFPEHSLCLELLQGKHSISGKNGQKLIWVYRGEVQPMGGCGGMLLKIHHFHYLQNCRFQTALFRNKPCNQHQPQCGWGGVGSLSDRGTHELQYILIFSSFLTLVQYPSGPLWRPTRRIGIVGRTKGQIQQRTLSLLCLDHHNTWGCSACFGLLQQGCYFQASLSQTVAREKESFC